MFRLPVPALPELGEPGHRAQLLRLEDERGQAGARQASLKCVIINVVFNSVLILGGSTCLRFFAYLDL